jgi:maltose/moltooligosaccharide transporter
VLAARTSRKTVHAGALICGALGLLSVYVIHDRYIILLSMVGVGIAWASILSMPYAILSTALPPGRMGVYMGVFNFFIVIPEILAALFFGPLIRLLFGETNANAPLYMVMFGGVFMLVAALCVTFVRDVGHGDAAAAMIAADEAELLLVQESAQPVPSSGLGA